LLQAAGFLVYDPGGVFLNKIRVFVSGAMGKMGQEVIKTILSQDDIALVGAADTRGVGRDVGYLMGITRVGVDVSGPLDVEALKSSQADILVDFTNPQSVLKNAQTAISAGVVPVIGTSGLDENDIAKIKAAVSKKGVGAFIASNFAIGAVLMMRFAREAAKYLPHIEIIELHHDQKLDAPSGTALKTAEWIAQVREPMPQGHPDEFEKLPGARGADFGGLRIHSVRLPGLVAHQEIIFGGLGQALTIRHDAITRETYMPGVVLAIRRSYKLTDLVIGLENFLD
jgi:4-hydroxy-tetrahydrodipicolinate reductase